MSPLVLLILAATAGSLPPDTTFAVPAGTRLRLELMNGSITVSAWDRNELRVQTVTSRRNDVRIRRSGSVVSIDVESDYGMPSRADITLTVPAWMGLSIDGMNTEVKVDGVRAPVEVETLNGDITVNGGTELIQLSSTSGKVTLTGARGRIELSTTAQDLIGTDLQGDVVVEAISGDVVLQNVDSKSVEVETVSGSVWFNGIIRDGGRYTLSAHSGKMIVGIPEGTNATITTSLFSGQVETSFPLTTSERTGRRSPTFRLGNGSAAMDLEAFSGTINLVRPAEFTARLARRATPKRD